MRMRDIEDLQQKSPEALSLRAGTIVLRVRGEAPALPLPNRNDDRYRAHSLRHGNRDRQHGFRGIHHHGSEPRGTSRTTLSVRSQRESVNSPTHAYLARVRAVRIRVTLFAGV